VQVSLPHFAASAAAGALGPIDPGVEARATTAPEPETLHPALWRAHQLGHSVPGSAVVASGHAGLDGVLPGGGWPARVLTELLLPHAGVGELRLLAPALAALQRNQRSLMWFDPPAMPCAWALSALGLDVQQLVVVRSRQPLKGPARARLPAADVLWALEQALKSGHLGAALAWLPARLPADALRRLQLAAQAHDGPVFLLRDVNERSRPSAAPLRLLLASAGADRLRLTVLKRRGPPVAAPILLPLAPVLSAPARLRALRAPALAPGSMTAAAIGALPGRRQPAARPAGLAPAS
jgi:protein ImuA